MPRVIALGEILVEIMRKERDVPHDRPGVYLGPYPSGAPAIFIDSVARLGESAGFIGVVGDDDFGRMLIRRLKEDGVDTSRIRVLPGYTTGTAFVMYYSSGERKFIFHLRHAAAGQLRPEDVDPDYIKEAKVIHIMGSALAVSDSSREACYKAVDIAYRAGITISFDPNLRPELLDVSIIRRICEPVLTRCQAIMPSGKEAEALVGEADPMKAAEKLIEKGPEMAIIKMGDEGSLLITREGRVIKEPAFEVEEVDPTGAGDVFDGAFIVAWLKGWDLQKALEFANAAGAIKVTRFGPMEGPVSFDEVMEFMRKAKKKSR
ncbi:MAG: sugar kinase [Thermoprotei archaeon]|nr:MAG: sugar kinase [Thermoprotei archaeon]RLF25628.1 MAG: sugar kinase [Thermoprotei archaeon]